MSVHERFRSERERLRLTQPDVAALADVGKTTVINWEKGLSSPTAAQLEVLADNGMDVLFVVTGRYAGGVKPAPVLSAEEEIMLGYFRDATKEVRRAALGALVGAVSATSPAPARDINISSHGQRGGVQIGYVAGTVTGPKSK